MKMHWIPLLIALIVNLAIDFYAYRRLHRSVVWPRWAAPCYGGVSALLYGLLCVAVYFSLQQSDSSIHVAMYLLLAFYGIQGPKFVALGVYSFSWIKRFGNGLKRFFRYSALVVFLLLVVQVLWGTLVTPYTIEVKHVTIESSNLPKAFDGYRIVQFSDAHVGTYGSDTAFVSEYVDSINAQNADMICFTGDLVNRHSAEVVPFVNVFSRLHAADGVISIQGNHDYKTYYPWESNDQWMADSLRLVQMERKMGWTVNNDSIITVYRSGDSIKVIGLHSFRPPHYKMRADLRAFYPEVDNKKVYKILLQHVPYVWLSYVDPDDELALGEPLHFDLMLSGHTHAMQIQATIFGKKISPSRFVSKFWGGKYQFGDQFLYVNTGVGEVGVPMRIGVKPEITVITLKKKQ